MIALSEARVGQSGVVERIELEEEVSHHLAHLGFLPGADVEVIRRAPAGDPTVYRIDGVEVGLRNETAQHIVIELGSAAHPAPSEDSYSADDTLTENGDAEHREQP